MALRKPLVVDDSGSLQQLQQNDRLKSGAGEEVANLSDLETLKQQFRLLLVSLSESGFELPEELIVEMEKIC